MDFDLPKFPLGEYIENGIDFLVKHLAEETNALSEFIDTGISSMTNFLLHFDPVIMILVFGFIAWWITRKWKLTLFTIIGFGLIWNLNLWLPTMQTLSLVSVATFVAIMLGIPLGVLAAVSKTAERIIMPILDFMQTLPAFVYLIPAIPFFGLGAASAMFSTVIFSMPPVIRLTALGIQQVPNELVEACDSFGSTRVQRLIKLELPIAGPSIRAGVNQTILLALSMVVIAAMIGAKGLGGVVWKAIQRLEPGMGFEAGISIVILAIILDRVVGHTEKTGAKTA